MLIFIIRTALDLCGFPWCKFHLSQIFSHLQKSVSCYFETYICIWGHAHSKFVELLVVICIATAFFFLALQILRLCNKSTSSGKDILWKKLKRAFLSPPAQPVIPLRLYNALVVLSCFSIKQFCRIFLSHALFLLIFTCTDTVVLCNYLITIKISIHTKYVALDVQKIKKIQQLICSLFS